MEIILIRHGQTTENQNRVVQWPDVSLSDAGLKQAELLSKRLSKRNISQIISSDMTRAAQTAAAVANEHDVAVEYSRLLHERNLGDLRGRRYEDIDTDFFAADYVPVNGESWSDFYQRVDSAWQYILDAAARCKGDLVVVTHGLVCHRIADVYLNQQIQAKVPEKWQNTSVTMFDKHPPFATKIINCSAHLGSENNSGYRDNGAPV